MNNNTYMREIPELTIENIQRMEDLTWYTHAQIFDDLLIVAQKETACYIWKTEAGLVVFDGIWPDEKVYNEIMSAIKDAGWTDSKIVKFVITHGHIDHVGCGKWFAEQGARTYLSKIDDELRLNTPHEEGRSDNWKEFDISYHLQDGDVIQCGDKSFSVISTPGHTDGCMSFFFPVHENGEEYIAGLFGGATARMGDEGAKMIQKTSVLRFKQMARLNNCQVGLTNHTAFDNGLERIAYSKKRMVNLPNIYILGVEGAQNFFSVFRKISE